MMRKKEKKKKKEPVSDTEVKIINFSHLVLFSSLHGLNVS